MKWQGEWERANTRKREKSEPKWLDLGQRESGDPVKLTAIFQRSDFMCSRVSVVGDKASNHNKDKRSFNSPLWMNYLIDSALSLKHKAKWVSDLWRYGTCTLRATSTLLYSTELMAISQTQRQTTNPGSYGLNWDTLWGSLCALWKKKGLGGCKLAKEQKDQDKTGHQNLVGLWA